MSTGHTLERSEVAGRAAVALVSRDAGLRAKFVPSLGMLGCSLTLDGEELLGLPHDVRAYAEGRGVTGIPLLHPWANRLGSGRLVGLDHDTVRPGSPLVPLDPNGLPIHGLRLVDAGWSVVEREADAAGARVGARLEFPPGGALGAAFPFPHALTVSAALAEDTLAIATTVRPTAERAVPVSFGWHPYFRVPGVPRQDWVVELPVVERAVLDERGLPTGRTERVEIPAGPLGDRTYDDLFTALDDPPVFALRGAGHRIEVGLGDGYRLAQVYAPATPDVIAFEPMTASTNAMVTGDGLIWVEPGREYRALFTVVVGRG
jgi:galactose mutarotase-like enzyme